MVIGQLVFCFAINKCHHCQLKVVSRLTTAKEKSLIVQKKIEI